MARGLGSRRTAAEKEEDEKEYEVDDVAPHRLRSSRNSRLELVGRLPPVRRRSRLAGGADEDGFLHGRIIHPDNNDPRWLEMVAAQPFFHFRGTPLLPRRWTRLTFTTLLKYRYSVRLYLEKLSPHTWSVDTVQKALPGCLIHSVAGETLDKEDLSYFVLDAWVEDLGDVPTIADIDIYEPRTHEDPFAGVELPAGFALTDAPMQGRQELIDEQPARLLRSTVLVHLDSSMLIRPVPPRRGASRDGGNDEDGHDMPPEERTHPWAQGVPDDVWHRQLEASATGSSAGQHRPRRRSSGGRRRALTPLGHRQQGSRNPNGDGAGALPLTVVEAVPAVPPHGVADAVSELAVADNAGHARSSPPVAELGQVAVELPVGNNSNGKLQPDNPAPVINAESVQSTLKETEDQLTLSAELQERAASPVNTLGQQMMSWMVDLPTGPVSGLSLQAQEGGGHVQGGLPSTQAAAQDAPWIGTQVENGDQSPLPFLDSIQTPIPPPLTSLPRSRFRRTRRSPGTATRRSHRLQNRKLSFTGSGNQTMKQARRLIMSKRGLAIRERGDDTDEGDEVLRRYEQAFDHPLNDSQMGLLSVLAKEAKGKKKIKAKKGTGARGARSVRA